MSRAKEGLTIGGSQLTECLCERLMDLSLCTGSQGGGSSSLELRPTLAGCLLLGRMPHTLWVPYGWVRCSTAVLCEHTERAESREPAATEIRLPGSRIHTTAQPQLCSSAALLQNAKATGSRRVPKSLQYSKFSSIQYFAYFEFVIVPTFCCMLWFSALSSL